MPQLCTECGKPSIPGMVRGHGKCQYHWNAGVYGVEWADKCAAGASLEVTRRNDPGSVAWVCPECAGSLRLTSAVPPDYAGYVCTACRWRGAPVDAARRADHE